MEITSEKINDLKKGAYITERVLTYDKNEKKLNRDNKPYNEWVKRTNLTETNFKKRLEKINLNYEQFILLINNSDSAELKKNKEWIIKLFKLNSENEDSVESVEIIDHLIFCNFINPFLIYAEKELESKVNELNDFNRIIDWFAVKRDILYNLGKVLIDLSLRVLIQELQISKKIGELEGDNKEERFNYFNNVKLSDSEFRKEIFDNYPVLARLLVEKTEKHLSFCLEFIQNYYQDFSDLLIEFNLNQLKLKKLKMDAGDSHNNGRSVIICIFDKLKLVYKPRSLDVDEHFNEFIKWINEKEHSFNFKYPKMIKGLNYGWQEFIEYTPCNNLEEVKDFYYRQGGYLAISYLFRSKDFHYENLVAYGAYPILIDLETLFDNRIDFQNRHELVKGMLSDFNESVISSGMLPFNFAFNDGIDFDLSALGIVKEGQVSKNVRIDIVENFDSDDIRFEKRPLTAQKRANVPFLDDKPIYSDDYINIIEEGFKNLYYFFMKNRKQLLASDGPIRQFEKDEIRHVLRATNLYSHFLKTSTYPKYLIDGLKRNRLFDILFTDVKLEDKYFDFVQLEYNDLLKHDIPYFKFKFNSKDLMNSEGKVISNFYHYSSLDLVMSRCQNLNLKDCDRQQRYIRMSLSTLYSKEKKSLNKPYPLLKSGEDINPINFLQEAKNIGDQMLDHLDYNNNVNGIGLTMDETQDSGISLKPFEGGIYDGLAGLSLFFGQLGEEVNDKKYKDISIKIFKLCLGINEFNRSQPKNISAFTGIGSIVYTAAYLGLLWDDKGYVETSLKYLKRIKENIGKNKVYDFITGEAGVIILGLRIYEAFGIEDALETALECGEYVYESLLTELNKGNQEILTGFSHGASGYAWSLLALSQKTGDKKYSILVDRILEYENNFYNVDKENWADLRVKEKPVFSSVYWCHGAPGIGLARMNMLSLNNKKLNPKLLRDLRIAINTTIAQGFNSNHSICHGDLGNLEVLLLISHYLQDEEMRSNVYRLGYSILSQSKEMGWMNGIDGSSEMFGFMNGLSGIGFQMLRLWNPSLPSILNLELSEKEWSN
ncbi:type 2 lanthipeptide synthetase LanM family protein [Bacillus swezeyi]|uniref:type 2 lanthipeptide synthetase LanM family protein n=1 Tax=Bacillus swezeyi TaxID=1925020 RepID=UPI002E1DDB7A|nr:type 2 lanthipeptide synthetase LanM family protein [Bacillus swezeyi]